MKSNLSKVVAEYLVKKLTQAGWQLTYGKWKGIFFAKHWSRTCMGR